MGYTTQFLGAINVEPPFNAQEIQFLKEFIKNDNIYPDTNRNLSYLQWTTFDGKSLEWDKNEKFYDAAEWMSYLIFHFFGANPIAKINSPEKFSFLQGHRLNGKIEAQGEEVKDKWDLIVENNVLSIIYYNFYETD